MQSGHPEEEVADGRRHGDWGLQRETCLKPMLLPETSDT